jgi:hypothetical protein
VITSRQPSGWAVGGTVFAGAMMLMIGIFQIIEGLVAVIDDDFFVVGRHYTFNLDTTGWGWIHLILGAIVVLVGLAVLAGQTWGLFVGIVLVVLWSIVVIAIDVFIVWSLARVAEAQRNSIGQSTVNSSRTAAPH